MIKFTGIPKYTVAQLEQRAELLLKQRCGWPPEIPLDIEFLVEREPGMLLDILPGLQQIGGVAGFVRFESKIKNFRVIIDADVADHPAASFYRFTVADEFAHVMLHGVSVQAMRKRLKEWPLRIAQKVEQAMRNRLTFLQ